MTDVPAPSPQLSPEFDRARTLSRVLMVILTISFWVGIAVAICIAIIGFVPGVAEWTHRFPHVPPFHHGDIPVAVGALLFLAAMVPSLFALHHARRVFEHFAKGEVFASATIADMRTAALWLTIAGIVPPRAIVLIVGISGYVAAYVMAEARRIADDNAGIV
jgi:hypothetical protein